MICTQDIIQQEVARMNEDESNGRIPRYTYYPLEHAINKIGMAVRELGGVTGKVSKRMLAGKMGVEENSATFLQQVASAKAWGVITGHSSYMLTSVGTRYLSPTDIRHPKLALIAFLRNPPVYKKLIDRYDGSNLPEIPMLANWLEQEKLVPKSWATRVSQLFHSAALTAGVIHGGILRVRATEEGLEIKLGKPNGVSMPGQGGPPPDQGDPEPSEPVIGTGPVKLNTDNVVTSPNTLVWQLGGVHLRAPTDMPESVWKMLDLVVQGLKPLPKLME
jgi:hypothetical protein